MEKTEVETKEKAQSGSPSAVMGERKREFGPKKLREFIVDSYCWIWFVGFFFALGMVLKTVSGFGTPKKYGHPPYSWNEFGPPDRDLIDTGMLKKARMYIPKLARKWYFASSTQKPTPWKSKLTIYWMGFFPKNLWVLVGDL